MHTQYALLQNLKQVISQQEALVCKFDQRIKKLPSGHLSYKNGYLYRVVRMPDKIHQLIISPDFPDADILIQELKERRHISKALPILKSNLSSCKSLLHHFQIYDPQAIREALPVHYRDFNLAPIMTEGDIEPIHWASAPYPCNTSYPDHLKYKSECGLMTRSKAEASIATKLEQHHLAFRYEPLLKLGEHTFSPDFCVLHPVYRRPIYWEHFGRMDDPSYAADTMEKLQIYAAHGYHLGDNLIMSWETGLKPLQFHHIEKLINAYFYNAH